ncbi:MAG: hypothetical protein V4665_01210 [Patescibacteria group bacterium]
MVTLTAIRHFVEMHADIAYILIVAGVIIEGEIVVILAGIFAALGSLNIFAAFASTLVGGGLKSLIGYGIGLYLYKRHSHRAFIRKAENRMDYFLPNFNIRQFWSMFSSRFLLLGLHWFSLVFAGYRKIKIKRFAKAEFASLLAWSAIMLSLGYFFSYTALSISRDVRKFLGIILIFFLGFFILEKIIALIIELTGSREDTRNKN